MNRAANPREESKLGFQSEKPLYMNLFRRFTCIIFLCFPLLSGAQDLSGDWHGLLQAGSTRLRLVFHIVNTGDGIQTTMDSPDQGALGIPVSSQYINGQLKIELAQAGLSYTAVLKDSLLDGQFRQGGLQVPLVLSRKASEKKALHRPQEPKPPFPYRSEEVRFLNREDSVTLAGTLTLPEGKGPFPVVVLVSGSGPQDRNEELFGHKPFLLLADHLTRAGIGVLRYDDRGMGASTGNFGQATSVDFARDAEAAVAFLKGRKEVSKIGMIGHSEGGIIAPMVAARNKHLSFIVLLAGTGIRGDQLLLQQQELIGRAAGMSEADLQKTKTLNRQAFDLVLHTADQPILQKALSEMFTKLLADLPPAQRPPASEEGTYIRQQVAAMTNPWMLHFIRHDPAAVLQKVGIPVLALNGSNDLQVPAQTNLPAIRAALQAGGNKRVTVQELPGLNHLFQESKTGSIDEYGQLEQTMSPQVLEVITAWIRKQL